MSNPGKSIEVKFNDLFSNKKNYAFSLLLILLYFSLFRPDKIIPGGNVLMYFPVVMMILLFFKWIGDKNKIINNNQTKFYFVIILICIIQLPYVRNFGFAYGAVKGVLIYGIMAYLFTVQYLDTYEHIGRYIRQFTVLSLFFAIMGIMGGGKVSIPLLGDENDYCLFVNSMIPFAFFLGQETLEAKKKLFYNILFCIFIMASVTSFSRGGFIGLVAVAFYLFLQSRRKIMYILFIGVVGAAIVSFAPPQYISEISGIGLESTKQDTGAERIKSWKAAWGMFKDHPVFGVGIYNFGPWFPDYWQDEEEIRSSANMWGRVAHSLYFTLLPETGIVGTLLFIGMLWWNYKDHIFICTLEKKKIEYLESSNLSAAEKIKLSDGIRMLYFFSKSYSGAMLAYLVTGIFISVLWYEYFWKLTAFWVATGNLARKTEKFLISKHMKNNTDAVE